MENHQSVVYIIGGAWTYQHCKYSYVGVTNNLRRRLKQHRGQLKGGAVYTKRSRDWRIIAVVGGLLKRKTALQLEWSLKHCRKRCVGHTPLQRRVNALWHVLSKAESWTRSSPRTADLLQTIWVWWQPALVHTALSLKNWEHLPEATQPSESTDSLKQRLSSPVKKASSLPVLKS